MFLSLPLAIGCVLYGWYADDTAWMKNAGIILAVGLVIKVLVFIIGERLKCPLCMAAPLRNLGCAKHRSAQTLFGSHKLAVATSVLFEAKSIRPDLVQHTSSRARVSALQAGMWIHEQRGRNRTGRIIQCARHVHKLPVEFFVDIRALCKRLNRVAALGER